MLLATDDVSPTIKYLPSLLGRVGFEAVFVTEGYMWRYTVVGKVQKGHHRIWRVSSSQICRIAPPLNTCMFLSAEKAFPSWMKLDPNSPVDRN